MRRSLTYAAMVVGALCAATAPAAQADVLVRFKAGASAADRADTRRAAGVRRERGFAVAGLEAVATGKGQDEAAARALRRDSDVIYAEPDQARRAALLPSDPLFVLQWGLTRISAPTAWDTTTGSSHVVVGVADTGVALTDPDLAPNLVPGWDFVGGDADPEDENLGGHGSHVAAVIGARGDDATGLAGVAWSTRIMPLRMLDANGDGRVSDAIKAYEHAAAAGVRIVNLSFAGATASSAERDALAAASHVLFVAAAGNTGADVDREPTYPCAYDLPNVLCVTASDRTDARPAFANVGVRGVDLAAPGVAITGPVPSGGWTILSGTSMAAPHVAGAAALLLAREPTARPSDLIEALTETAEPAPAFAGVTVSGGRLDVAAALDAVRATSWPTPSPTPAPDPDRHTHAHGRPEHATSDRPHATRSESIGAGTGAGQAQAAACAGPRRSARRTRRDHARREGHRRRFLPSPRSQSPVLRADRERPHPLQPPAAACAADCRRWHRDAELEWRHDRARRNPAPACGHAARAVAP